MVTPPFPEQKFVPLAVSEYHPSLPGLQSSGWKSESTFAPASHSRNDLWMPIRRSKSVWERGGLKWIMIQSGDFHSRKRERESTTEGPRCCLGGTMQANHLT